MIDKNLIKNYFLSKAEIVEKDQMLEIGTDEEDNIVSVQKDISSKDEYIVEKWEQIARYDYESKIWYRSKNLNDAIIFAINLTEKFFIKIEVKN